MARLDGHAIQGHVLSSQQLPTARGATARLEDCRRTRDRSAWCGAYCLWKFGRDFSSKFRLLTFGDFSSNFAGSYLGRIAVDDAHVGFSEWTLKVYLL